MLLSWLLFFGSNLLLEWYSDALLFHPNIEIAVSSLLCALPLCYGAHSLGNLASPTSAWSASNPTAAASFESLAKTSSATFSICIWIGFALGQRLSGLVERVKSFIQRQKWKEREYVSNLVPIAKGMLWIFLILLKFDAWYILAHQLFILNVFDAIELACILTPLSQFIRLDTIRISNDVLLCLLLMSGWSAGLGYGISSGFSWLVFFQLATTIVEILQLAKHHSGLQALFAGRVGRYITSLQRRYWPSQPTRVR